MDPFLIIVAVLFFTILDAIGKAQKKRQREQGPSEVEDASDPVEAAAQGASRAAAAAAARKRGETRRSGTLAAPSEDVIVPELWEEIRRLARGRGVETEPEALPRAPRSPARTPPSSPTRTPSRTASRTAPGVERAPPARPERHAGRGGTAPVHAIHKTHPLMGRPLAERRSPIDRPITEAERHRSTKEVGEVRAMLTGGPGALRRAVILEEVLGPPAAVRGDPYEPGG